MERAPIGPLSMSACPIHWPGFTPPRWPGIRPALTLAKHNKREGSRALAPWATFEAARLQGYEPGRDVAKVVSLIEGASEPCEIAVLHR